MQFQCNTAQHSSNTSGGDFSSTLSGLAALSLPPVLPTQLRLQQKDHNLPSHLWLRGSFGDDDGFPQLWFQVHFVVSVPQKFPFDGLSWFA